MPAAPAEQAALSAAIVADPADDTLRLAYADWLQEHGDEEQAQFIRDSIKHAKMKGDTPKRRKLGKELRILEMERGPDWMKAIGLAGNRPNFTRGIAENAHYVRPAAFFREVRTLFRLLPVTTLSFGVYKGRPLTCEDLVKLARTPELARVRRLELIEETGLTAADWRVLFQSPHLSGLTALRVADCGFGNAEAEVLASSPVLEGLTELDLEKNRIGLPGCRALAASPHLTNVEYFRMYENVFSRDSVFEEARDLLYDRFGDPTLCIRGY